MNFRGREPQAEDYAVWGRWLQESWALPDRAARPAPTVVVQPYEDLPQLTPEVLRQMTTFWTSFQQEPESIRTTARRAHVREVVVPGGSGDVGPHGGHAGAGGAVSVGGRQAQSGGAHGASNTRPIGSRSSTSD